MVAINNATWHYFPKGQYYFKLSVLTKKLANAHLLSPTSFIPPLLSFCPTTQVVYDTASLSPQAFARNTKAQLLETLLFVKAVAKSNIVVTISHSVAKELAAISSARSKKVIVVSPGLREFPLPSLKDIARFGLKKNEYFLYVGTLEPRKNIVNLIAAYQAFLHQTRNNNPPKLVLAGQQGWHTSDIFAAMQSKQVKTMVIGIDSPSDRLLSSLYKHCLSFCYVSHYEGFGMPILEAMSFGKAVLISDIPVFTEVARPCACRVDPKSVSAIARGLRKLFEDSSFRLSLESHTKNQVEKLQNNHQIDHVFASLLGLE
jgi:glycosyltransferase involved in cell wall biosynthesis